MKKARSLDDVIKKIQDGFDNVMQSAASDFGRAMQNGFDNAIDNFYASYAPRSYRRTYMLYQLSNCSIYNSGKLWQKIGDHQYSGGIMVSPIYVPAGAYIKVPPHGLFMNANKVFELSYMRGIHGFTKEQLTPKPISIARNSFEEYIAEKKRRFKIEEFRSMTALARAKAKLGKVDEEYILRDAYIRELDNMGASIPKRSGPPYSYVENLYKYEKRLVKKRVQAGCTAVLDNLSF